MNRRSVNPFARRMGEGSVGWRQWNAETLRRAASLDRPLCLCLINNGSRWSHMMKANFEEPEIIGMLNNDFIPVLADSDDVPHLALAARAMAQIMLGHAGWPLFIFMTPEKKPIFACSYLPKQSEIPESPGLLEVLRRIKWLWLMKRPQIDEASASYGAQLEEALSAKTRAVMIAHTLGNPFDIRAVKTFCEKHGLWLVEDNCDALGSRYELRGEERYTGTCGDIGTSSFYPPHHMTMGEGGAVYTQDPLLFRILRSLRDWGRDCICPPGQDGFCGHRFDGQYGELPKGYDHKYVYSHFGYNLKVTDMQAAVGCAQLRKLPGFIEKRRRNFARLKEALGNTADRLILPEPCPNATPSWFGFLLTCCEGLERESVVRALEAHGIQTRMLFAGNLVKHPCFDRMREEGRGYRIVGQLAETDRIMKDTFWLGVYPGMTEAQLDFMADVLQAAVKK